VLIKIKEGKAYLSAAAVGPLPLHEGTKQGSMRELNCLVEYTGKVQDPNTTLSGLSSFFLSGNLRTGD
jgi:hypothetical protein